MEKNKKLVPKLRFSEFTEGWTVKKIGKITDRVVKPVEVEKEEMYQQIGIRSHLQST